MTKIIARTVFHHRSVQHTAHAVLLTDLPGEEANSNLFFAFSDRRLQLTFVVFLPPAW